MIDYKKQIVELGFNLNDNQVEKLVKYCKLIEQYNKSLKLVACSMQEFVKIHIYDILQITKVVSFDGKTACDVGSGNGLPAIPLSIFYEDIEFSLVERMKRRVDFLLVVKTLCGLKNVHVLESNDLDVNQKFEIYTARAFSNEERLASSIEHLLINRGVAYLYKGQRFNCDSEVKILEEAGFTCNIIALDDVNGSERNLIQVTKE